MVQIQPGDSYAANSLTLEEIADRKRVARPDVQYHVRPGTDPCFFPGMNAEVVLTVVATGEAQVVGVMGVVHPEVLTHFDVHYPCSVVELDVEAIM